MKNVIYQYRTPLLFLLLFLYSILESQDLKKEINIPFPVSPVNDSILPSNEKKETIIKPEKELQKDYINIPFPDDKIEKKNPNLKLEKLKSENSLSDKQKINSTANTELPLENLFVFPEIETIIESNKSKTTDSVKTPELQKNTTPSISEETKSKPLADATAPIIETKIETKSAKKESIKTTDDIRKALLDKDKSENSKYPNKSILKNSKITELGESGKDELPTKDTRKANNKKVESKTVDAVASTIPLTDLPNADKSKAKKGKDKKKADESAAPFERSKFYLNRNDQSSATPELNIASSGDGEKTNLAKMDQIRLFALERKKNEAKSVIDGISEPEFRFKGLYELAVGLENSAKGDQKLKEEAIPLHLMIITEAPKTDPIVPKSLWALSHLLFTIGDHMPALDHLSEIILTHSNSEFADDAIYLSGRIYEESTTIRNLNRARKYYELFLKNESKAHFKNSIYLPFVKKRLDLFEN